MKKSHEHSAAASMRALSPLLRQSIELMRSCTGLLTKALPGTDPELIGGVFAGLLDLWETGQRLDLKLRILAKLQLPRDLDQARDILLWVDAIQLEMGSYWILEVQKDLPKLLKAMDRLQPDSIRDKRRSSRPSRRVKAPSRLDRT